MSGIAGLMTADGSPPAGHLLDRLATALAHRGQGSERRSVSGGVGFAQIDSARVNAEAGRDEPVSDGLLLALDGHILELGGKATDAVDKSPAAGIDNLLRRYRRYGASFVDTLRGAFACAVFDPAEEALLLARDVFGVRSLYYVEGAHDFAFASEPQALIAAGLAAADVAEVPRDELLQLQFTTGRETIFPGVFRLLPGETLVVTSGRIVERRRREALPQTGPDDIREDTALARFEAALTASVAACLSAGEPPALILSASVKSAALLAMASRLADRPPLAFCIRLIDGLDEREYTGHVAAATGAELIEVGFGEADFWRLLPEVAGVLDDPVADYAALPVYKLAKRARRQSATVLTAEGCDVVLAGYGRYRTAVRPWYLGGPRTPWPRGRFDRLELLRRESSAWRDGIRAAESLANLAPRSRLQEVQALDCATWLPNDLLLKLDRALAAHGMQGLTPYLDERLTEIAFRLPDSLKVRRGVGMYLLRRWLDGAASDIQPFVRHRGPGLPTGEWLHDRGDVLGELVAQQPGVAEIALPDRVRSVFRSSGKRQGFAAWSLLFYALWHRRHILGQPPVGDTFDSLAATRQGG